MVLVLFIFLMNWRTTLISLVSIPLSIVITLLVTRLMGLTINTILAINTSGFNASVLFANPPVTVFTNVWCDTVLASRTSRTLGFFACIYAINKPVAIFTNVRSQTVSTFFALG